jgi:hypothetical protein
VMATNATKVRTALTAYEAHAGLLFKLAKPPRQQAALMAAITASSVGAPVRCAATDCRK